MQRREGPSGSDGEPGRERAEEPHREDLAAWRALCRGGERQALDRIARDARLRLVERCLERMRARRALLDPERVIAYFSARLVFDAGAYDGRVALEAWLDAELDTALEDLVLEDVRGDLEDAPLEPDDERYAALARDLGVDVRTVRRATVIFERLPQAQRGIFYEVVLEEQPLDRYAVEAGLSLAQAQALLERATESFCSLGADAGTPDLSDDDGDERRSP